MITTLRIRKEFKSSIELAIKWYSIISILNNFKWSPIQIKIMAFTAVKGDISSGGRINQFCSMFNSTASSVTNSISRLYKKKFLIKDGKTRVNPHLHFNLEGDLLCQIMLANVRED